jgi:hypothetical protein
VRSEGATPAAPYDVSRIKWTPNDLIGQGCAQAPVVPIALPTRPQTRPPSSTWADCRRHHCAQPAKENAPPVNCHQLRLNKPISNTINLTLWYHGSPLEGMCSSSSWLQFDACTPLSLELRDSDVLVHYSYATARPNLDHHLTSSPHRPDNNEYEVIFRISITTHFHVSVGTNVLEMAVTVAGSP